MQRLFVLGILGWASLAAIGSGFAAGKEPPPGQRSAGNADGLLTWELGNLPPGRSATQTVVILYDTDRKAAFERLATLRRQPPTWRSAAEAASTPPPSKAGDVWLENADTNFALAADGAFFWEAGQVQSLRKPAGRASQGKEWTPPTPRKTGHVGQLSRWGYYLHYDDGHARHAGTRISGAPRSDGLIVRKPTAALAKDRARTLVATEDGRLALEIRTFLPAGPVVLQEYVVTNPGARPLTNVRLSVYANLEADHTHDNDVAFLDPATGALVVEDPATKVTCLLAGTVPPLSGWAGVWPSQGQLSQAAGPKRDHWLALAALPAPAAAVASVEPPTVSLTPAEAENVLEADWLLQAEGTSLAALIHEELAAAREIAARLQARKAAPDLAAELAALDRLETELAIPHADPQKAKEAYLAVRRLKRRIILKNPVLDFSQVVFIDQPFPHGREWQHQARHRNGMMATPGGRLLKLEGLSPAGKLTKVVDLPPGSYWRPDISFDGRRVLFCYKAETDEAFHLYEADLDSGAVKQLTSGPFDDLDPIYLPDGGIAFVSTRSQTYVRCMPYTHVYTLCRMNPDGSDIRIISHNNEPDWTPSLMDDGRLLYSRWEYTDKALWRIQSLWTVRPDGAQHTTFYGNQSVWPDHLGEARQIPGTSKVLFTGTAHHDYFAGSLGIIDASRGLNYPDGLTHLTSEIDWPECGRGPKDAEIAQPGYRHRGRRGHYKSPYPLDDEHFLVSINTGPFNLYLMDIRGNKELIYRGTHNLWYAQPVRARKTPPALKISVDWPTADRTKQKPGIIFSSDVYENSGIPRGMVKYLRVLQAEYTTFSTWDRDFRFEGPSVSVVEADNVKRILGTTPVEPDGSFSVEVPSGVAIHFQLLDQEQRALQTMRSFTGVMPGEVRGCFGCHEGQTRAPVHHGGLALRRKPSQLTPPPWGDATISYEALVQPVLNKYCASCHDGGTKSPAPLLKALPGKGVASALHPGTMVFSEPYVHLINSGLANVIMAEKYDQRDPAAYRTFPPLVHLSYKSRLVDLASSGKHYGVKVDETSRLQLIGWIDANGPYRGMNEIRALADDSCKNPPLVARP